MNAIQKDYQDDIDLLWFKDDDYTFSDLQNLNHRLGYPPISREQVHFITYNTFDYSHDAIMLLKPDGIWFLFIAHDGGFYPMFQEETIFTKAHQFISKDSISKITIGKYHSFDLQYQVNHQVYKINFKITDCSFSLQPVKLIESYAKGTDDSNQMYQHRMQIVYHNFHDEALKEVCQDWTLHHDDLSFIFKNTFNLNIDAIESKQDFQISSVIILILCLVFLIAFGINFSFNVVLLIVGMIGIWFFTLNAIRFMNTRGLVKNHLHFSKQDIDKMTKKIRI